MTRRADAKAVPVLGADAVDELRRRNTELEALHETTLGLIDGLDLSVVLDTIIDRAGRLIGTPHGYLYLVEDDGEFLRNEVATGVFTTQVGYRVRRGQGLAGRVLVTGAPLVIDDYRNWEHRFKDVDHLNIGALVGVPLHAASKVVGVIGLAFIDDDRTFGEAELAVLERFARLASLALNNAKIYAALKRELGDRTRAEEDLHQAIAQMRRSEAELHVSQEEMIRRLAWAIEFRDTETGRHTERMGRYCSVLARRLGLDEEHCELIRVASGLHDIGKIAIPDSILLKTGELTPDERSLAERHTVIGHTLLAGSASPLLDLAATIALTHHEWFDGAGYPTGLRGDGIPLEGRIAAVADVFDALTNDRPYRAAYSTEEAFELMARERGAQFDPLLLDLFFDSAELLVNGELELESVACSATAGGSAQITLELPDMVSADVLAAAVESALTALRGAGGDARCVDAALGALVESGGRHLLPSVYVVDHDRLWLVAQRGYEHVRDGFGLDQGVIARAVRTGDPQFLPNVADDPEFIAAANAICSEIAIPFGSDSEAAGVLNVETRDRVLPPESVAILSALAGSLGERADRMRRGVGSDVASLARLFVEASLLRGVGEISEFACRTLGRLLGLEAAQVSILTSRGDYASERFWRRSQSLLDPLTPEALALAAREARAVQATCSILDADWLGLERRSDERAHALIWLPLRVGGQELGVLLGQAPAPLELSQEQLEAATLVAQHAASLLDAALALRREQRAAVTDELTGLLNRRGFRDRFREELDRCVRAGGRLALVTLDCDDLKAINDRGGHELGDAVLQMIGEFLRTEKRREDVAARLGGDEFGLLLPDGTSEAAVAVAERLRRALIARTLESGHPITATFGVAAYPGDGASLVDLLRAADRAMYQGKLDGKNRTLALVSS